MTVKACKCPICGSFEQFDFRPFCSKRCANRDLGRWLNGDYKIPGDELLDVNEQSDEDII